MSVATSAIRSTQMNSSSSSPQMKQGISQNNSEYSLTKKIKKEENYVPVVKIMNQSSQNQNKNELSNIKSSSNNGGQSHSETAYHGSVIHGQGNSNLTTNTSGVSGSHAHSNGMHNSPSISGNCHPINGISNGLSGQYSCPQSSSNGVQSSSSIESNAPLQSDIFELLNEFWRPNELVSPDTHIMNGKFSRRSPDGSIDETAEEEKEGDDDGTSLADNDPNTDRNTQKRRYSRLSDGYERLKSVLPSVKDKRRVSKARILDEAINYIQRLESITNVLKREHEKRLSMLNSSSGFFPDYSVQPYMRSLFQNKIYPPGMSPSKMSQYSSQYTSQYSKMSNSPSSVSKSPRLKQYSQQYSSQSAMGVGGSMGADYNYNNISNYSSSGSLYQSTDPGQLINGETSPLTNSSPYSACSVSPGSTPTTYQNGSAVNNSWPYPGGAMACYSDSTTSQLSGYSPSRQGSTGYGSSSGYSSLNSNMWGSMGMTEGTSQVVPHAEHTMKVG